MAFCKVISHRGANRQAPQNTLPAFKKSLEIGVDGGGSLRTVLQTHVPADVVLIDSYNVNHAGHGFTSFGHIIPILKEFNVPLYRTIQRSSQEVLPLLHGRFSLITVDGDHAAEPAMFDLVNSWGLLRRGGMLVFDDCGHHVFPHLARVLEIFLKECEDAELIEEEGAPYRNCAILRKR